MKLLEVIVTSLDEAKRAEDGGAHRLELVRDLDQEGLTPPLSLLEAVLEHVSIPVRVMVRQSPAFHVQDDDELRQLTQVTQLFSQLPVDGLVLGFLNGGSTVDEHATRTILESARGRRVTFHRAIEAVPSVETALTTILRFPQFDRVLTSGGTGTWAERRAALERLQRKAGEIRIIAGGGLTEEGLAALAESALLHEFHVGRAARAAGSGVCLNRVARLRRVLNEAA